uniref:HDC03047 n=1 Tax=Drosophila melanogaster TaxID=7227 RepID=Q6IH80_DROME|nr:TPA_inf: HDC03047 [Drosophila melanogaster]
MDSLHDSNKDRDEVLKRFIHALSPVTTCVSGSLDCPTGGALICTFQRRRDRCHRRWPRPKVIREGSLEAKSATVSVGPPGTRRAHEG